MMSLSGPKVQVFLLLLIPLVTWFVLMSLLRLPISALYLYILIGC